MIFPTLVALCCGFAALTTQEEHGREIYLTGQATDGSFIGAVIGGGGEPLSATLLPCVNCHGSDGRGLREGGLKPPDITAGTLGRDLSTTARTRSAYTPALLKRAITMGWDSAGNTLDPSMPRFQMNQQNAIDLLAYLAVVGRDEQPGLSDQAIYIDLLGAATQPAFSAPIYGRRVQLREHYTENALLRIDVSDNGDASLAAANRDQIPTLVYRANRMQPGAYGYVISSAAVAQAAALRVYALSADAESVLYERDCADVGALSTPIWVLMTAAAARNCDLSRVPAALDRRLIVATTVPPGAPDRDAIAQFSLALVAEILAKIGRDPNRAAVREALEQVYKMPVPTLPAISWSPNSHYGNQAAWLMTLDPKGERLLAEPGWVHAE